MDKGRAKHPSIWLITLTFSNTISLTEEDLAVELVIDDIQHKTNLSHVVLREVFRFRNRLELFIEGVGSDACAIAQMLAQNLSCKVTYAQPRTR